ncbi:amidohydrolase family protein [Nonomuraea typhae]|uniref:amidohydrolase family protein n=1 Tax=Nonomuraea typhae TaxID=2603600 RepID=UPI0012F8465B|nr:amidohydrolase family protein [Nonomuraea typhae]
MRIIRADRILTGRPGEIIENGEILIDGGVITAVGPRNGTPEDRPEGRRERRPEDGPEDGPERRPEDGPERRPEGGRDGGPEGAEIVELPGRTVLPGLVDAHVHLGFSSGTAQETDARLLLRMAENARKLVAAGVTTARDLGGRGFLDLELRDAIEAGLAVGPHVVAATRPITITGGHCWHMGGEADDEAAIRRVARENLRAGADCLKVMASGGRMTPGGPQSWQSQYTAAQIRVVVEEAAGRGKGVAAHAHAPDAIRSALEAGVATIEHCTFLDATGGHAYDPELVDRIAAAETYVCPTVHGLYWTMGEIVGIERMERWLSVVSRMHAAGVKLIAGTDSGFVLGSLANSVDGYVGGLEAWAEAGLGNAEIIELATVRAAEAIGLGGVAGVLEAGRRADVIAVRGNPLTRLADLRDLDLVLVSGRPVTQSGTTSVISSSGS